jgi:hypothetical protein
VLEGTVAVVEQQPGDEATPQVIAVHGPGRFLGGLNMLAGHRPVRSVVVQEPGAVLTLPVDRLRAVLARDAAGNCGPSSRITRSSTSGLTPPRTPRHRPCSRRSAPRSTVRGTRVQSCSPRTVASYSIRASTTSCEPRGRPARGDGVHNRAEVGMQWL